MIIYFTDRNMNVLGQASTNLPRGITVTDDKATVDVETGTAIFECKLYYDDETRALVESCAEVGNYILYSDSEHEFYQIVDFEHDTKRQQIYLYAEDEGMDLLNDMAGDYEADKAYNIAHYINKYAADAGFVIGTNEVSSLTRKLKFTSEQTAQARILSIAQAFDAEIKFSFDVDGLQVVKKYINIYEKRGEDTGICFRLNYEIDSIITTKSITNLATALTVTGGTPEKADDPITLKGYTYDDGDIYVDSNGVLKSREALKRWARILWKDDDGNEKSGGHITRSFSYDTLDKKELCEKAIEELKLICDVEVNYEVEIPVLPDNIRAGDRVNIIDDAGELYLSTRILTIERSVANNTNKVVLGEHLLRSSGISQKVIELAAQFAKNAHSAAKALSLANTAADKAAEAQTTASNALTEAGNAQTVANEAKTAAENATQSAENAQTAASNAQQAVENVEKEVESLNTSVANAQAAAEQAQQAAVNAETKATEAHTAAVKAQEDAGTAKTEAAQALEKADSATSKADEAKTEAEKAITDAEAAATTAAAAKLDAENAQKDIDSLGENLTTLENTMTADYARKTDLTEAEASLQTQITQNASEISSTASKVQIIDETANNAKEQAEAAQTAAEAAQSTADAAQAEATAAQTAADNATQAANAAQSEADAAKAAAATAQSEADKAKEDLATAQAELESVKNRVGATEEEITAAQNAVNAAQAAADKAQADAQTATEKAVTAQNTADTAVTNAKTAQSKADEAAAAAILAQTAADEAKGDATAAQTKAQEALTAATNAQNTADTAAANAATAQSKANEAAQAAATAQQAADDADAKAAQAQTDLDAAKQNLEDVTSRVGATEEEIAAAQQAVVTAQAAADQAKTDAEAAQSTADTAKADAEAAQTAADNAKSAADQAQADADTAKAAADAAQKDVDALAVRVTTAETKITQNTEQIALMATKQEVEQTLGGYYTKEQTDAAIELSAEGIHSSVSQQITEIQVGGRNLLLNTAFSKEDVFATRNNNGAIETTADGIKFIATDRTSGIEFPLVSAGCLDAGSEYVLSFEYRGNITTANPVYVLQQTTPNVVVGYIAYNASDTEWQKARLIFSKDDINARVCYALLLPYVASTETETVWLEIKSNSMKLEKGNKATDWTPAPEDIDAGISDAQNTADNAATRVSVAESDILQLADMIASLVTDGAGASLMTQTGSGWSFNIGNIIDSLSKAGTDISDLSGQMDGANSNIDALQKAVNDLGVLNAYINITTYNGQPCIELGQTDSGFLLRITNTEIQFADGTVIPAYITNKKLMIESAEVKEELQFGQFAWKARKNGNIGLVWKGAN